MLYIIANEKAGSGTGAAVLERVCAMLREKQLPFRVEKTESVGHASVLADLALASGETEIVCIGGDGTLFEVVNGLRAGLPPCTLSPAAQGMIS